MQTPNPTRAIEMIAKKIAQLTYVEGRHSGINHTAAHSAGLRAAEEILQALRGPEENQDLMHEVRRELDLRGVAHDLFVDAMKPDDGAQ